MACGAEDDPPLVCVDSLPFIASDGRRTNSRFQSYVLNIFFSSSSFFVLVQLSCFYFFHTLAGSLLFLHILEQLRLDFPRNISNSEVKNLRNRSIDF